MSVTSLNRNRLSDRDVSAILSLSYRLSDKGVTGGGIPVEMDDGGRLVAVLDPKHHTIALAFGRNEDGYYVFDHEGRPIAEECQSIEEIIGFFVIQVSVCKTWSEVYLLGCLY